MGLAHIENEEGTERDIHQVTCCTGCFSIGTHEPSAIVIDRVIEYFDPRPDVRTIWLDIFLSNPKSETQPLFLLHRGNLRIANVTDRSWTHHRTAVESDLSDYIQRLHSEPDQDSLVPLFPPHTGDPAREPIEITDDGVRLNQALYGCWSNTQTPARTAGSDGDEDVPFTMWELRNLESPRSILRLKAQLASQTYEKQVGHAGVFEAHGEAILLDKIACEDIPSFDGEDAGDYREFLRSFNKGSHLVPRVFEYLIVAPGWKAHQRSYANRPFIYDKQLQDFILWFVADIEKTACFSLAGGPCNAFKIEVYEDTLAQAVRPGPVPRAFGTTLHAELTS